MMPYLYDVSNPKIKQLIRAVISKQLQLICIDSYANAFMPNDKQISRWASYDETDNKHPIVWERKFELDSLCYPLFLIIKYFEKTNDTTIFNNDFIKAFDLIISTCQNERNHSLKSEYYFIRRLPNKSVLCVGKNTNPNEEKGLVWSGFRPSDDLCQYNYHIPDNMFFVSVINKLAFIFKTYLKDDKRSSLCKSLVNEISILIDKYGVIEIANFGQIYVLETDCLGHFVIDDDANIPSLLSIPYLEYPFINQKIYENTRRYILSNNNHYYFAGKYLKGIGSPHTPKDMVWPLSVIMQGMTAKEQKEKEQCLHMVINSMRDNELVHEAIDINNPNRYTRPWFCWANSLFAEFCLKLRKM